MSQRRTITYFYPSGSTYFKDDKISKEFYYLGTMKPSGQAEEFIMNDTDKKAVEIEWILDEPVRDDIYEYIVSI